MNFLAHCFLSGPHEEVLIGNFIGDHVKGNKLMDYPEAVVAGIRLHRQIDSFTDSHPVVEQSKKRVRPRFRKYAPVIVDMYYDHLLARNWPLYSQIELKAYAAGVYKLLGQQKEILPERTLRMLPHFTRHDWLSGYASLDGLDNVLHGMARRTSFKSNMEQAAPFLELHYEEFGVEFQLFFPELQHFVMQQLQKAGF